MKTLQFRLAARTDAAGKYNPEAPLEGNEDNMFVDPLLDDAQKGAFMGDEVVDLSERGCLMVIADGMGGMNAGEVASDIAIKTVMEYFSPEKLTDAIYLDSKSRIKYMEEVVVAADTAIKADSSSNQDHEGMGSTIIMAWLCDGEICLTWCGDSRAYLFRPTKGFWQVSKDHSYVQGLVDEGKLSIDDAFDHPYGNIVTRSLGDPDHKAKPESRSFKVYEGDIFMLCSDGLSGVLRDHKTFKEGQRIDTGNLEDIILENRSSMVECRDKLFEAAERNEWYDNVTAILCEIVIGEVAPKEAAGSEEFANKPQNHRHFLLTMLIVILLGAGAFFAWKYFQLKNNQSVPEAVVPTEENMPVVLEKADNQPVDTEAEETLAEPQETKEPAVTPPVSKAPKTINKTGTEKPSSAKEEPEEFELTPATMTPTNLTPSSNNNNEN